MNPPLILNSVLMVSLPSVILYKHLLNSHRLVVVNPPFDFSRSATVSKTIKLSLGIPIDRILDGIMS